jgi:hypothetical protein
MESCKFKSFSGEVYSMQYYLIKFVNDLLQVGGFLRILQCGEWRVLERD